MTRADLLSLSADDLSGLVTRGALREATADLDSGRVTGDLTEADGGVRVTWSDGVVTEVAAAAHLRAGRCSCPRPGGCKHLLRLALLYQRSHAAPAEVAPWGPERFSDEELERHYDARRLQRCRERFEAGVFAELQRGTRPVARFHQPPFTARFLSPDDLRYARCDCGAAAPCDHVPLAVWAFRRLSADQSAGVITAGSAHHPVPVDALDEAEAVLHEIAEQGFAGLSKPARTRLGRLGRRLEAAGLVWPAGLAAELAVELQSYDEQDSRFAPEAVALLAGELLLRNDAIRRDTGAMPALLVRGDDDDRPVALDKAQFRGLGCEVTTTRRGAELTAYLYDVRGGGVGVIRRAVPDRERDTDTPRPFAALGDFNALPGLAHGTFAALGLGALQISNGKRTPRREISPGRKTVSLDAEPTLRWEEVEPPVRVERFADLEARLADLPPSALRPRRLGDDFHVLTVAKVADFRFDSASHEVRVVVEDADGRAALVAHPYTSRGRAGADALLLRLASPALRFVAGRARRAGGHLLVRPAALVWDGERRTALQPWIAHAEGGAAADAGDVRLPPADPADAFLSELTRELGELLVVGLGRADASLARRWAERVREAEAVGFARLAAKVAALADALAGKSHTLAWDVRPASAALLGLAALARLAADVG